MAPSIVLILQLLHRKRAAGRPHLPGSCIFMPNYLARPSERDQAAEQAVVCGQPDDWVRN